MTAVTTLTGAASHAKINWHAIAWHKIYQNVRRLQARIVKAIQESRWSKVKALQRRLTHSFSGKALAVRRVTENQGQRTPGLDQEIWDTPQKKAQAVQKLKQRGYQAQPLRRVYLPKSDSNKKRALGIPTMSDRGMQTLYWLALDPIAETTGDPNSYGFRKERSTADAIARCLDTLSRKTSARWILNGDIRACFDEISSEKSVKAFMKKIREIMKGNKQATVEQLIMKLNPVIRGWANYHQHVVSKKTFNTVDHAIFKNLWQWARRRHSNKSPKWIKEKYFRTIGGRNWVFSGPKVTEKGTQPMQLFEAGQVSIKRHTKIKSEANPYDPKWEIYLEKRLGNKMAQDLKGRRKLLHLWKEQNGTCPICRQKITKLSGWHNHHIVQRTKGGSDGTENRVLLHPDCHRQVHNQGLKVEKPRPRKGV